MTLKSHITHKRKPKEIDMAMIWRIGSGGEFGVEVRYGRVEVREMMWQ